MTLDTFGPTLGTPLAEYDHDLQSWRMYGVISLWGLTECLQTLPKSGMTQSGRLFPQPALAPLIDGKESSAWPTPRVTGSGEDIAKIQERFQNGLQYKQRLEEAVAMWPTPTHGKLAGGSGANQRIEDIYQDGIITLEEKKAMQAGNGGRLNPMWVEWLMGFPLGWTDLED